MTRLQRVCSVAARFVRCAQMLFANQNNRGLLSPSLKLPIGWLTMFVIGSDLFVVSPLLPQIAADCGLSLAGAGLSVTVFAVTYMLSAPLLGHGADKVGHRRVVVYSLCAVGLANPLPAAAR